MLLRSQLFTQCILGIEHRCQQYINNYNHIKISINGWRHQTAQIHAFFFLKTFVLSIFEWSLNPLHTNGFFLLVWYHKLGKVPCTYLGVSGYNFQINIVLFCLKIFFALTNSVDTFCKSWAATYDFQQCGILTSVDSDEPAQPP